MELSVPAAKSRSPLDLLGLWRRGRRSEAPSAATAATTVQIRASWQPGQLEEALDEAWKALREQAALPRAGRTELSVRLGLAHTRVGLMQYADESMPSTAPVPSDAQVQAWVQLVWSLDPKSQIIRWEPQANGGKVLVVCTDRQVFEVLNSFAQREGFRFVSCQPEVLSAREQPGNQAAAEVRAAQTSSGTAFVWLESLDSAPRSPLVQLLHVQDGNISAAWRGWMPPGEDEHSSAPWFRGALHRFFAAHRIPEHTRVVQELRGSQP